MKRKCSDQFDLVLVACCLSAVAFKQLNVNGEVCASCVAISIWVDLEPPGLSIHHQGLAEQNRLCGSMLAVLSDLEHLKNLKWRENANVNVQFNILEIDLEASQALLETR